MGEELQENRPLKNSEVLEKSEWHWEKTEGHGTLQFSPGENTEKVFQKYFSIFMVLTY